MSADPVPADQQLADRFGRPLRDLRISVTDRCNFRCRYCMPREVFGADFEFLPRDEILTFEEIARLAGIAAQLGVRKIRLTGGEPTLRADLPELVRLLKEAAPSVELAMTTNGSRLTTLAAPLAEAGLDLPLAWYTFGPDRDAGIRLLAEQVRPAVVGADGVG